jgi:hypothetical protein
LSPENWCFCVENGVFFGFGDHFGVFLAIWGCKTGTFSHFLWLRHSSAGRWDFGATPHLLNVTVQRTAHFVRRTLEPIVRHFMVHDGILGSRHP